MTRLWTIIGVEDLSVSFKWYQSLLGRAEVAPAHDYWGQICDVDGAVLLCLHEWGSHDCYRWLKSAAYWGRLADLSDE